jgi:hypothetical protein
VHPRTIREAVGALRFAPVALNQQLHRWMFSKRIVPKEGAPLQTEGHEPATSNLLVSAREKFDCIATVAGETEH